MILCKAFGEQPLLLMELTGYSMAGGRVMSPCFDKCLSSKRQACEQNTPLFCHESGQPQSTSLS